jgi:broad specificity phosphatase PhoE
LTELGHQQAEALSKRLALYGLDEIYASTSIRAQMTAEPTCKALGKTATLLDWANESLAWEDFHARQEDNTVTWAFAIPKYIDLFNSPEVIALGNAWYTHPAFSGLNFARGVARIDKAVDEFMLSLGYKHDRERRRYLRVGDTKNANGQEKRIALFAHQGFGIAFFSSLLDIPYPLFATHFDISHSCMSVVAFEDDKEYTCAKVLQHSNDSHLYKENLMRGYNNSIHI